LTEDRTIVNLLMAEIRSRHRMNPCSLFRPVRKQHIIRMALRRIEARNSDHDARNK